MLFFYDGQIRRYIAQMIRMLSDFKIRTADGTERTVPVMYGDLSRQVANIIRNNSENKLPSAPRISIYVSDMQLDKERLSDASFVSKINVRERNIDPNTNTYMNIQGQGYTVERLMPVPYKLKIKADIWTSNTEQKLQLLEQLFILFNPSFEIQTTDNFIDWTSLTVVYLDDIVFSNRTIPVGTDSDIDVATLTFDTPIWISTPAKIKKLGVIQAVISNIFSQENGHINADTIYGQVSSTVYVTPKDYGILVIGNVVRLLKDGESVTANNSSVEIPKKYGLDINWYSLLDQYGQFFPGRSRIYLSKSDGTEVVGTASIDPSDETIMIVNWDPDTFSTNTVIAGRGTIDAIIDPLTYNPGTVAAGIRYLILSDIGSENNQNGPNAWKNSDNSDFVAHADDIIEWNGTAWNIVFDAATIKDTVYVTNLRTTVQYKWDGEAWTKSFEGEYTSGKWRLEL